MTSANQHLHVETEVHQQVALLARALGITPGQTIAHLLHLYTQPLPETPARAGTLTPVYAIYQSRRVDGDFDRSTGTLSIPVGPGMGQYRSPSGAASAVISALRPHVSPVRTGWAFCRLSETGAYLATLRGVTPHTSATTSPPVPPPTSTAATTPRAR